MSDLPPLIPARGAVILCDHLATMQAGKWLIVGTFTTVICHAPEQRFAALPVYVRAQVEDTREHQLTVRLIVRDLPPHVPSPLPALTRQVATSDPNVPIEVGFSCPPFAVQCPVPFASLGGGKRATVHLTVWAEIDDCPLASSPLNIVFAAPRDSKPGQA
ncbi:MAG: hypothetical protein N3B15_01720 [Planctomycetota bacterium]|nr:hypothetical protein [Planctomycetota bacterium]